MPGRPSLLDNRRRETEHGEGLAFLSEDLSESHGLSVATGYVNLGGLRHLACRVSANRCTRLLLGAAPGAGLGRELPATLFQRTLEMLRCERDLARFPPSRELAELLEIRDWLDRSSRRGIEESPVVVGFFVDLGLQPTGYVSSGFHAQEFEGLVLERCWCGQQIGSGVAGLLDSDPVACERGEVGEECLEAVYGESVGGSP